MPHCSQKLFPTGLCAPQAEQFNPLASSTSWVGPLAFSEPFFVVPSGIAFSVLFWGRYFRKIAATLTNPIIRIRPAQIVKNGYENEKSIIDFLLVSFRIHLIITAYYRTGRRNYFLMSFENYRKGIL